MSHDVDEQGMNRIADIMAGIFAAIEDGADLHYHQLYALHEDRYLARFGGDREELAINTVVVERRLRNGDLTHRFDLIENVMDKDEDDWDGDDTGPAFSHDDGRGPTSPVGRRIA